MAAASAAARAAASFFCLLLGRNSLFLVRAENLILVVNALDIALIGIEVPGANLQKAVTQRTVFKINEPRRIKRGAVIPCLKVKVGAGGASGRASKADDISSVDSVPRLDVSA